MRLRWGTWNLWAVGPAWRERFAVAQEALRELDLDVICLQEVRRQADLDAGRELADALDMHLGRGEPIGGEWWSRRVGEEIAVDNVVLSRWPIVHSTVDPLPHEPGTDERRSALHLRIEAPTPIRMVTTQLASAPDLSALRVRQVRAIASALAERRRTDEVVLVAGDLNAEPDSDEVRLLCGHKTAPPVAGHVLMDLWRFAPPGTDGDTWDRSNPHVAASSEPSSRIDYLLAAPTPSGRLPEVETIRRIGEHPIDGIWPSDHAGVMAVIHI
jgi:endonuclease/exonuclease/phosphatase family metal-dependent hydrolase